MSADYRNVEMTFVVSVSLLLSHIYSAIFGYIIDQNTRKCSLIFILFKNKKYLLFGLEGNLKVVLNLAPSTVLFHSARNRCSTKIC